MGKIEAASNMPYKKLEVDMPSMRDVRCLMEDFGGSESETTAVMQYIYQSYITGSLEDEWHELFMGIAKVEMHHHHMLGELIVALGGTPIIGGNKMFWNGACVNYERNLCKMIECDILAEKKAISAYRRTIMCLENFSAREMIERIIKDEEVHIVLLEEALIKARGELGCKTV